MSRSRSRSKDRRLRKSEKREERERDDKVRYRSSRRKDSKKYKDRNRNRSRNTSRSKHVSAHQRSRKRYGREIKSSSRDYKKRHFSSSSDSSTDHRSRKRSRQRRSNGKERKSSRLYSSSTSRSSSRKSSSVIAGNHSLGSLVGLKQASSAPMFSSSIITNYQQTVAIEQPLPPGVASEYSSLLPSNNQPPPPPPPLPATNLTLPTPITMIMPPFMSSMPPPSCIPVPTGKPPSVCIPMPVPPPPPLPKVGIPVQQPPPLPCFKVTPFVIRPNSFYNPSISTPICFAPFSEVPPPPPPFENNDLTQEVNEPSTSNASQSKSATLQLPYPNLPVLQKRDYEKPVILNKRKLPDVLENWGVGNLSNYKVINQVGEGTYGQVYKALKRSNGQVVALKKVRLENEREGFPITAVREIKILRQLDHKNVVKLYDIVTGPKDVNDKQQSVKKESGAFYLVFEYVDHDLNGLLDSNIVEFSELQITSLFKQLILALEHCHNLNFLHRDLKCANILINNRGELKLADFGLARLYLKDVERLYTNRVITLWYRSPELLLGQERYGTEVDIWSAGCILGELFVKKPIFQGNVEQTQLEIISQFCGSPSPENWPEVVNLPNYKIMRSKNHYSRRLKDKFAFLPAKALDLLDRLLQLDPRRRPSAEEALNHPWLLNIEPDQIPPPELPRNQDCHEMWSKKMRAQRNSHRNSTRTVSAENTNSTMHSLNISVGNTGSSCNGNSHHQHFQKNRRRE